MSSTKIHYHHILPKHMGGSDDPSNIVPLSVECHAKAHEYLYERFERKEDHIACRALSGQITMSEAKREAQLLGASKGGQIGGKMAGDKCRDQKIGVHAEDFDHSWAGKQTVKLKVGIHAEGFDHHTAGKKGGERCRDQKIGIHAEDFDRSTGGRQTAKLKVGIHAEGFDHHTAGKKGGDKCRDQKIGFHAFTAEQRSNVSKGKIWIRKETEEQKIYPRELDEYLIQGWECGRKKGFRKKPAR